MPRNEVSSWYGFYPTMCWYVEYEEYSSVCQNLFFFMSTSTWVWKIFDSNKFHWGCDEFDERQVNKINKRHKKIKYSKVSHIVWSARFIILGTQTAWSYKSFPGNLIVKNRSKNRGDKIICNINEKQKNFEISCPYNCKKITWSWAIKKRTRPMVGKRTQPIRS